MSERQREERERERHELRERKRQRVSYPAEIANFNSPNRELSNFVRLMELYGNGKVDPSRSQCLKIVNGKRFERRYFFCVTSCPAEKCIFQLC